MDSLDPARTALLVVHMAKGVAGQVDTPFNRLFRQRAEKTGVVGVQARLLDGFRKAKAKVVSPWSPTRGCPGSGRTPRCFARSSGAPLFCRALPRLRSSTKSPPGPKSRSSGDRRQMGSTALRSTPFSAWQALIPSCSLVSRPTSRSNPPRALHATGNIGRSSSPTPARPTATKPTPARSTLPRKVVQRDPHRRRGPQRPEDSYRRSSSQSRVSLSCSSNARSEKMATKRRAERRTKNDETQDAHPKKQRDCPDRLSAPLCIRMRALTDASGHVHSLPAGAMPDAA